MTSDVKSATILVVDDEPTIADTVGQILVLFGYQVLKAYDGENAFRIALETPPTLVLSDVMLPGMNGIELVLKILAAQPACKVVLFSGQAGTAHLLEDARRNGHQFHILAKPVHPSELLEHLKMRLAEP